MSQRYGQNFLRDPNIARVAIDRAGLRADDVVLEVGPGRGILTALLAPQVATVQAVEIDRALEPHLAPILAAHPNVLLTWGDAMQVPLDRLDPPPTAFVANLPYNVATPLILRSLDELPGIDRWCVMVQREIADRLFAVPSTPAYGAVSVLMQLACERTDLHPVGRAVFDPPPRVDSALVAFRRRADWPERAPRWSRLAALVHAGFRHRRKTLANGLAMAGIATRAQAEDVLAALGHDPRIRAEAIAPEGWPPLLDALAAATVDAP
ncbi:MAG: 16S rRNA (adenine(1518)-N(6)/adenine(1519)-N(6))-dimethyltransferase RsmA [Gaiellales bacterium]